MRFRGFFLLFHAFLYVVGGFAFAEPPEITEEPDFYSAPGVNAKRSYELTEDLAVDMFTGTLQTHSSDLVLPGIGPEIVVQRSYNSVPNVLSEQSYMGPGWDIHFGRIVGGYNCANDVLTITTPRLYFIKPDGSQVQVLGLNNVSIDTNYSGGPDEGDYKPKFITSDLWRVECRDKTLVITDTNDIDYHFGPSDSPTPYVKHVVIKEEDSSGNYFDINYALADSYSQPANISRPASIHASDGRVVTFSYTGYYLTSVSDGDIEVKYIYENNHLARVEFPESLTWLYEYLDSTRLLSKVTTPLGAQIDLTWDNMFFRYKDYPVLKSKCIADKCWSYTYARDVSTDTGPIDRTTVDTPFSTREVYSHVSPVSAQNDEVWTIGLLKKKEIYWLPSGEFGTHQNTCDSEPSAVATDLPIHVFLYEWDSVAISSAGRSYINNGISLIDSQYRKAFLKKSVETKNDATYTYEVISHDAAGLPLVVREDGNATRYTNNLYYNWGQAGGAWLVGLPAIKGVSSVNGNFVGVSETSYNEKGQVTKTVGDGAITNFTYYTDGTLKSSKDGVGNETVYSNYYRGIAQRVDFPDSTFITRTVDNKGRVVSEINQNQIETTYTYDDLNRVNHIDMPLTLDVDVTYQLRSSGGISKSYTKGSAKDTFEYDQLGRLVKRTKFDLNSGLQLSTITQYNERNQVEFVSNVNDATKGTHYRYDRLGNLVLKNNSAGEFTAYEYGPNKLITTDSKCNKTTEYFKSYSALDQALEKIAAPEGVVIDITRNLKGQPLTVSQNGVVREYSYNVNWMLNHYKDSEVDAEYFYVYDDAGRVTASQAGVDEKFYLINYEYDPMGRIAKESYSSMFVADQSPWELYMPDSCEISGPNACFFTRSTDTFDYNYDGVGNLLSKTKTTAILGWGINGINYRDASTGWEYLYNEENHMTSEELHHGLRIHRLNYEYDMYGHLGRVTYPGGFSIDYDPDVLGRPTKAGNVVTSVEYFDQGPVKRITYGNGQVAQYTLNDRLMHETYRVGSNTSLLIDSQYSYDLNRNLSSIQDFLSPQKTRSMQYDGLDRLTSASGVWGTSQYAYDQLGNITSKSLSGRSYDYDYARNRLERFDGAPLHYDMYGRVVKDGRNQYFYDFSNNLTKAKEISKTYSIGYEYDANNRMAKRVSSYPESYVYSASGKLMYEEQKSGALKRDHIYLGSQLVGYHDIKDDNYSNTIYYQPGNGVQWVTRPNIESLIFSSDITSSDLTYFRLYNNLVIVVKGNFDDKISVDNYFINHDLNIVFSSGETAPQSYLANGIIIDESVGLRRSWLPSRTGATGPFDFSETSMGGNALLVYRGSINWYGTAGTSYSDYIVATKQAKYSSNVLFYEGGYLEGFGGDDSFRSENGNDHMIGGAGSDTYTFKANFGFDTIDESATDSVSIDRIVFSADIKPQDLALGTDSTKSTLLVYHEASNSLLGFRANSIESITFADGTVWDKTALQAGLSSPSFLSGRASFSDFCCISVGTTQNDFLLGAAFITNNVSGGDGDDHLRFLRGMGNGSSSYNTGDGGAGNDLLEGSAYKDILYGGDGDDTIRGSFGPDVIEGGSGSDLLHGDQDSDSILGGHGTDFLYGGDGADALYGDYDDDYLNGGDGADSYYFGTLSGSKTIDNVDNTGINIQDVVYLDVETFCAQPHGRFFRSGYDLIIVMTNGRILIKNQFLYEGTEENKKYAIDSVVFNDGTTFDVQEIIERAIITTPTEGDDYLLGSDDNDAIDGQDGNDQIFGGGGNDVIFAGDGENTVFGEHGNDEIQGGPNNDVISGGPGDDLLFGGEGNDRIEGNEGNDHMEGGRGDDLYVVYDALDAIVEYAGEGNDEVISMISYALTNFVETLRLSAGMGDLSATGNSLDNSLYGNEGANLIDGREGADKMYGYRGNDTYIVDNTGDQVFEIEPETDATNFVSGADLVNSSVSFVLGPYLDNLTLTGLLDTNGTGNELNNILTGNPGSNILDGGAGADTLVGGNGNDIYIVSVNADVITEQPNGGTDTAISPITYTIGSDVENLTLTGADAINGTGNTLNNYLIGNEAANTLRGDAGNDTLDGGLGNDRLEGGAGNDTFYIDTTLDVLVENASAGTDTVVAAFTYTLPTNFENLTLTGTTAINGSGNSSANVITGNSANNTLNGGTGVDTLIGKAGDDSYVVDNTADVVTESLNEGTDSVLSSVTYTLSANVENLTLVGSSAIRGTGNTLNNVLIGNSAANTLTGSTGNDTLNGGTGADTMVGGAGDDVYTVERTTDIVTEVASEGSDTVNSSVTYTLASNIENLVLTGTTAINGTGNALNNTLTGNNAANTLTGGAGNDVLDGLAGTDSLTGGAGNDTYVFGRGYGVETVLDNDSTSGNNDLVSILSGVGTDQIWFRRVSNNLEVSIIGTSDRVIITNWYTGTACQIEQFQTADGKRLLLSNVANIVNAMASLAPPASGQTTLTSNYQAQLGPVISANWQ